MENFSVIVLSEAADFLVKEESSFRKTEKGVEIEKPFVMTEEEKVQRVQAEKIFIPFNTLHSVQYGDFTYEEVE